MSDTDCVRYSFIYFCHNIICVNMYVYNINIYNITLYNLIIKKYRGFVTCVCIIIIL